MAQLAADVFILVHSIFRGQSVLLSFRGEEVEKVLLCHWGQEVFISGATQQNFQYLYKDNTQE